MKESKVAVACLVMIVIFLTGVVLRLARPVLFPLFLAVFISFILLPVIDFFGRYSIPRFVSIVVLLLVTFAGLYLMGTLFFSTGKAFADEVPRYVENILETIDSLQHRLDFAPLNLETINWEEQINFNRVGGLLVSSLGPFLSFISKLFLVFIFLVFIIAGRGKTKRKIDESLTARNAQKLNQLIENIDSQIQRYLGIKTAVSFFTGVFVTVVLLLFGLDFAIFFGFLTFILNYIPNIGSIIATIFPVTIALLQFDSIWPAFWIMVILMVIQQIMGNFVEPRLMGTGLGLSPLVVLVFLFFWGWLWGIPGMILAVPVAAVVKIVCANIPDLHFVAVLMSNK